MATAARSIGEIATEIETETEMGAASDDDQDPPITEAPGAATMKPMRILQAEATGIENGKIGTLVERGVEASASGTAIEALVGMVGETKMNGPLGEIEVTLSTIDAVEDATGMTLAAATGAEAHLLPRSLASLLRI